jgi:hypothetical protein
MTPSEPDMTPQVSQRPATPEPPAVLFEGWHDSSLELKRGLIVTEHGPLDPLAEELAAPLASRAESLTLWIRPRGAAGR